MAEPLTLAEAVERTYSVQQCAAAANVSRHQMEGWLARGFIKPEHKPAPPAPRKYTYRDVLHVAIFAEMVRLGLPIANCISGATFLPGMRAEMGILAFWQGPMELIGATDRSTGKPLGGKPGKAYNPDQPPLHARIVPVQDVVSLVTDPDVRALVTVNLAHVEQRVLAGLAAA